MIAPIEIVDPTNRHLYMDALRDMWRMRFRVAKRFNWTIPTPKEGVDRDEFDTNETIYLLLRDEENRVVGCSRLNPTMHPHMLDTVFHKNCDLASIPRTPHIWEFSRMFVDRQYMDLKSVVRNCYLLMSGVAELSVAHSLDGVSWYTSMPNYQAALACWRQTYPIGRPAVHKPDNVIYVPAFSPIDEDGLARIKERARFDGLVTRYHFSKEHWSPGEEVEIFRWATKDLGDAA